MQLCMLPVKLLYTQIREVSDDVSELETPYSSKLCQESFCFSDEHSINHLNNMVCDMYDQ